MTSRIEGFDETFAAFDRLGAVGRKEASVAVAETTLKIHSDVLKLIQRGEKSGRLYIRGPGQNRSREHTASAPGEAPATDTGSYVASINRSTRGLTGEVFSRIPRSYWLEYGTVKMAPRPHFVPAADANRDYFLGRVDRALVRAEEAFNQ